MGREQFPAAVAPPHRRSRSGSTPALRFGTRRPCRYDQRDRKDGNSCMTRFLDWRSGVRAPRTATPSKMRPRIAHGGNHGHGRWHTACNGKNMAESVRHPEVFKAGEPLPIRRRDPVVEKIAYVMDGLIPIGRWRFGLDSIIGLIPGLGDVI